MTQTATSRFSPRRSAGPLLAAVACVLGALAPGPAAALDGPLAPFERPDEVEPFPGSDAEIVESTSAYVYVLRKGERVWRSPKAWGYFAVGSSPDSVDLDRDGQPDLVWYKCRPRFCHEFGLFVSLRGGRENYLLHFNPGFEDRPTAWEVSAPLRREVVDGLGAYLLRPNLSGGTDREEQVKLLREGRYTIMRPPADAYRQLQARHEAAMKLLRSKGALEASFELDELLKTVDFTLIDPDRAHPDVTAMLNDYGYLLWKSSCDADTLPVLAYVLERDPSRTVALLNMADALYDCGPTDKSGGRPYRALSPDYYARYVAAMRASGKAIPQRALERMGPAPSARSAPGKESASEGR